MLLFYYCPTGPFINTRVSHCSLSSEGKRRFGVSGWCDTKYHNSGNSPSNKSLVTTIGTYTRWYLKFYFNKLQDFDYVADLDQNEAVFLPGYLVLLNCII